MNLNHLQSRAFRVAIFMLPLSIIGCASPPAEQAIFGNPKPLIDLVLAGQIQPNERLAASNIPGDTGTTITPLCALIGTVIGAPAVEALLLRGADVNMPCNTRSTGLPLDIVIDTAVLRGAIDSPFRVNKQYRPEHIPVYLGYAERLIGLGARSKTGDMSMGDVRKRIREEIDLSDKMIPLQTESYNNVVNSRNSLLNGLGVVLGAVVATKVLSNASGAAVSPEAVARMGSGLNQAAAPAAPTSSRSSGAAQQSAGNLYAQPTAPIRDVAVPPTVATSPQSQLGGSQPRTYQFDSTIKYVTEGIGSYTQDQALASLHEQRQKLEGSYMGHSPEWRVVGQTQPICTYFEKIITRREYWSCTMNVTYTGRSWLNPDSPTPAYGGGSTR